MKFPRLRPLAVFLLLIVPAILAAAKEEEDSFDQLVKEANRNPREAKTPEVSVHSTIDQVFDDLHDYLHPDAFADPAGSLDEARRRLNQQALAVVALDTDDPQMRRAAANALTDEELLAEVARTAPDPVVRLNATRKLTDLIVLDEIAASDQDPNVRHVAATRLEELRDPEAFAYAQVTLKIVRAKPVLQSENSLPVTQSNTVSPEAFDALVELLYAPSLSEAVAQRFSDEERTRFLSPYQFGSDADESAPSLTNILTLNRTTKANPDTHTLIIGYTHPDAQIAARVANLFADEYVNAQVRIYVEELHRQPEELRRQMEAMREKLAALQAKATTAPLTLAEEQTRQALEKELKAKTSVLEQITRPLDRQNSSIPLIMPAAYVVEKARSQTPTSVQEPLTYAQATVQVPHPFSPTTGPCPPALAELNEAFWSDQQALARSSKMTGTVAVHLNREQRQRLLAPYQTEGALLPTLDELLENNHVARPVADTWLIQFGFYHPDPELAAAVANLYANKFLMINLHYGVGTAMRKVETLRAQVDELRAEIKDLQEPLAPLQKKADTSPLPPAEQKQYEQLKKQIEAKQSALADTVKQLEDVKNAITLDDTGRLPRIVERAQPLATPTQPPVFQPDPIPTSED